MEKRQAERVPREKAARRASRVYAIKSFLPGLVALHSDDEHLNAPLLRGNNNWLPWSQFQQYPSLQALVDDDTTDNIWRLLKLKSPDIVHDLKVVQMKHRRVLARLLQEAKGYTDQIPSSDNCGTAISDYYDDVEYAMLERDDLENLAVLNEPTSLLETARPSPSYRRIAYPAEIFASMPIKFAIQRSSQLRVHAQRLLAVLGLENATMEDLVNKGAIFQCGSCPDIERPLYHWDELVRFNMTQTRLMSSVLTLISLRLSITRKKLDGSRLRNRTARQRASTRSTGLILMLRRQPSSMIAAGHGPHQPTRTHPIQRRTHARTATEQRIQPNGALSVRPGHI